MKLGYDNLMDAQTKLVGTYCIYAGKAVTIKSLYPTKMGVDDGHYSVTGVYMNTGREFSCEIDDPKFNCSDYNIGYLNRTNSAAWFYRVPMKQYKQGLRYDQVNIKASAPHFMNIELKPGKYLANMLENIYPSFDNAAEMLKLNQAVVMAFHKNFAMTWDRIHEDLILEYKGNIIGYTHDMKSFSFLKGQEHLNEALKEAIG